MKYSCRNSAEFHLRNMDLEELERTIRQINLSLKQTDMSRTGYRQLERFGARLERELARRKRARRYRYLFSA